MAIFPTSSSPIRLLARSAVFQAAGNGSIPLWGTEWLRNTLPSKHSLNNKP